MILNISSTSPKFHVNDVTFSTSRLNWNLVCVNDETFYSIPLLFVTKSS